MLCTDILGSVLGTGGGGGGDLKWRGVMYFALLGGREPLDVTDCGGDEVCVVVTLGAPSAVGQGGGGC